MINQNIKTPLIESQKLTDDVIADFDNCSFTSRLFFSWISNIVKLGSKKCLEQSDLNVRIKQNELQNDKKKFKELFEKLQGSKQPLIKVLLKQFIRPFLVGYLISTINTILSFSNPLLIIKLLEYLQNPNRTVEQGLQFLGLSLSIKMITYILEMHGDFQMDMLAVRISNLLNLMVYDKTLNYSIIQSKEFEVGKLVNLMQVDTERIAVSAYFISFILNFPVQMVILIAMLFYQIGYSFIAGFVVIVVIMLLNFVCGLFINSSNVKQLDWKDKRMKIMDEFINGIKTIKLNQWFDQFSKNVESIRTNERYYSRLRSLFVALLIAIAYTTSQLIQGATLTYYTLIGNQLEIKQVMSMLASFGIVVGPMIRMPYGVGFLLQAYSSVKRIQSFLQQPDMQLGHIFHNDVSSDSQYAIKITDGNFQYSSDTDKQQQEQEQDNKQKQKEDKKKKQKQKEDSHNISLQIQTDDGLISETSAPFMLQNLNIKVKKGQLVAIIGKIGSGKTSILQCLTGEVKPVNGETRIEIDGKMSYVPQKSWCVSGTIQKNIELFNPTKDEKRLDSSVIGSSMQKDLEQLNKKVLTEIGNNGINLSGGQKARLNVARALYQENDIILMDDPLSALDLHVGEYIMQETVLKELKGKTIVMVTHALNYLKYFDYIYFMEDGKVSIEGDYKTISENEQVQELIKKYKSSVEQLKNNFEEDQKFSQQQKQQVKQTNSVDENQNNKQDDSQQDEDLIIDEDRKKGAIGFKMYWHFFKYGFKFLPIIYVLITVAVTLSLEFGMNFFIVYWVQDKYNKPNEFYIKWYYALIGILAFSVFSRLLTASIQQTKLGKNVHRKIMKRLNEASINNFFERVPAGRILSRISKDLSILDDGIGFDFTGVPINVGRMLFMFGLFFQLTNYISLVMMFLFLIASIILSKYFMKSYTEIIRLESISKSPICVFFKETCDGLTTVRSYSKQQEFYEEFLKLSLINKNNRYIEFCLMKWFQMRFCMFSIILTIFNTCYILFFFDKEYALAALLYQYSSGLDGQFRGTILHLMFVETRFVSYERAQKYTEIEPEKGYSEESRKRYQEYRQQIGSSLESWPSSGKLEFQGVSTRYRENLPLVLKDLEFKIESGQKVGIVGRTGAGKSTLMNLFFRILEPETGKVLVDGHDINNIELDKVRSAFSLISQDPYLFEGTLQSNLDPQNKHDKQYLNKLIDRLDIQSDLGMKLDDAVSKEGGNLSAGQKQLVCILRAIVGKSKIILVDEATANIDVKTEKQIQKMIGEEFKDRTVLTIAHRINTLQNSDMILVINKGQVEEFDKPSSLLNNPNSFFKQLCDQLESNVKQIQ